ncbi:unnamed protein product [Trichobilharzia szidati]|nr:unnamed protein product [Trichobilharzia szidati]CAH8841002.1 unnamed protein product [Trichobilharzia szidati]
MQDNKKEKENTQELSVDIEVTLLDGRLEKFCLSERCLGQELFTLVIKKIGFFEYEYFGLLYIDFEGNRCWIDNNKPLTKVLRNSSTRPLEFLFAVKFFTPYPNLLEDDLTRYLYALQIRNDFFQGLLHSNRNTSLLLAAFIAQSQLGDFQETECRSYAYLKKHHMFRTAPDSYLMRLMELHQTLIGITKSEADYRLLDAARKVELYGIRLHAAKSMEDRPVNMGVNHIGIMIFEKFSRVNTFNWSMIRKLSFKRRKLLLKLHMEAYGYGNDTIEFSFPTRNSCKNFWKKCIEQHTFFRSMSPYDTRQAGAIHRGSSVLSHSSPGNLFTFPFTKLRRSASCGANSLSNSRGTYKRNDEENSETSNRKSSQTSHLSTPVKRFAHLNLTGSSFHYTGRTQKQLMESDPEHLKFSSEYNSSSLKVNPYSSMRKKSHLLTKLLAQKHPLTAGGIVGGGSDHLELFRLSFTSLIPYPSSTFNNNNNNNGLYDSSSTLYGKSGFKWNCNRAVSTSSIDRQVSSCRRKVSTHSYVPRHFSGTISRQSSVSQDVHTIDWSDSKYYNEQSTYTNHLTKRPSEGCLSKTSTNMFKPCVNESPNSSSCSLTSESYPRPVAYDEPIDHPQYLLTSKSDLSNLQITELDYSADEKDTSPMSVISTKQNLKNCTYAIQSPLMTSLRQFGETELSNNHQELLDKENYSGSHEGLHHSTWDNDHQQKITSPSTENDAELHVSLAEVKEDIKSVDRYSADDHQDIDDNVSETHSPYQVSLDNFEAFSQDDDAEEAGNEKYDEEDKTSQCRSENDYAPNGNVSMDASLVDLQSLGKSHDNSLFNSSIVFSEELSLDGNKSRPLSTTDIAHSELIDDLESDIQSDQYVHMDEAPESLADAISLGAISLITGLSEDDDDHDHDDDGDGDGDDDGRIYSSSKGENLLNVSSVYLESDNSVKVKHAKSLTHLPRREVTSAVTLDSSNINNQGMVESDKQSLNEPPCELVRVKSQQIFSNTDASFRQQRHHHHQLEADSSVPSVMLSTPTLNGTANQVDQKISELLTIASGCLDIFKEVLLTETMYNHDLEFLLATPLDIANSLHATPLINWLQNRLLPAVKPIYDRQVSFLHQIKITVSTLKRLISRVKLLSKQVFSKSKDNDGDDHDDDDDDPMRHLFPSSVKINHDSLISMHHISKSCVSSSELSLAHTTTTASHVNEIEELSTSEISSCRLSPQFIKHKHKKCALHAILKELQNLSCCINLLMNLLDQLQCYEAWIKNSVNLLTELWLLAFSDVLSSHPNKDTETANNRLNGKSKTQITDSDNNNNNNKTTENIQSFNDEYSPTLIRKVLYSFEEESSSLGSIWHYLLLPSRRFRSYCHLLQSLVDQLSHHSCSVLCKAVFSHFLLTCRSLDTTLDQAERVALAFQLSVIVFPLEKFFFTSDETIQNHINMSTSDKEDQQNSKPVTDECRMKDAECNDDYGDNVVVVDRLQGISTCLLHSLTTYPLIRFGWLNKYSRRGFQPRLIFLFTDRLIYASRIRGVLGLYLKLHGIISLANTTVERNIPHKNHDSIYSLSDENKQSVYLKFGLVVTYATRSPVHKSSEEPDSCVPSRSSEKSDHRRHTKSQSPCRYRLRKHRKRFIFGVPNQSDYETWINDISRLSEDNKTDTANEASTVNDSKMFNSVQMGKYSGVVRLRDSCTSKLIYSQVAQRCIKNTNTCQYQSDSGGLQTTSHHKSTLLTSSYKNNLVEFCWRQHSSISCIKLLNIIDDEMSGYLFRLSKRGTGSRQKLWAILSDLCLKFYKTYHHYKLLARLWLSSDKCTIELITLDSLSFEHDSTGVDCEHHRHKRHHHHHQQRRHRHHVVYGQAIKISHNSKDYYFQAENEFLLKRWYNSILNVLNCSTSERGQIENTLTDDDLALVNESISTSCLSTTSDAKLIFTCRSVSSEKPKEQFEVNNE